MFPDSTACGILATDAVDLIFGEYLLKTKGADGYVQDFAVIA